MSNSLSCGKIKTNLARVINKTVQNRFSFEDYIYIQ